MSRAVVSRLSAAQIKKSPAGPMDRGKDKEGHPGYFEGVDSPDMVASLLGKWEKISARGSPSRTHRRLDFHGMRMYVCPNGVGVLVLENDSDYSLCGVEKGSRLARGAPLARIGNSDVCFPFSVKVIECWEHRQRPYVAILQALGPVLEEHQAHI